MAQSKAKKSPSSTARKTADVTGNGGELHQGVVGGERMTTDQGAPIGDGQNSLKAGERGPTLLEDFVLREKIFHFDHERIPERVVHARGYGAHGTLETLEAIPELTRADLFQRAGEKTEAFVRFSTVAGNLGSADLARDVRGFAVKLYTQEGNWDLVGNNIPVFFIQDAMKFPDLVHAVKEEPDRGWPQAASAHDTFWDFVSLMPESTHMLMWAMSDRAIPRSFRFMEGFGVHTFRFVNADGDSTFVKFHWKPAAGVHSLVWEESQKLGGIDPDFHRRDLHARIASGNLPQWELGVQRHEVPEGVVRGLRLRDLPVGVRLGGVDQVRELDAVLDEEHRDVVADQVEDALLGVELRREATGVADRVGRPAGPRDRGEPNEHRCLDVLLQERSGGQLRCTAVPDEGAVRAGAAGVDDALRDALVVEVGDLLAQVVVLEQGRPAVARSQGVVGVAQPGAQGRGEERLLLPGRHGVCPGLGAGGGHRLR